MDPILLVPIVAAIIAFGGAYTGARVARSGTRYSARLQAVQRLREAELAVLREFGDGLLEAAIAVQSYTFAIPHRERLQNTVDSADWPARRAAVEPALLAVQRAEFLAARLPWQDVKDSHQAAHDLLMAALVPGDSGRDVWDEGIDQDQNVIVLALAAVSKRHRDLLETFPVDVPNKPGPSPLTH